mgnify:CR=1 FL=1
MSTVNLVWNANSEIDLAGYKVYRALGTSAPTLLVTLGKVITYTDTTIPNVNQTVAYQLSAFDSKGNESAKCAPVSIVIDVSPPTVPTGLTVSVTVTVTPP